MIEPLPWITSPQTPQLEPAQVHIWRATENDVARDWESMRPLLNREELKRADQYKFDRDRRRFVFCRGVIRHLIGQYTAQTPGDVAFSYGPYGKPELAPGESCGGGRKLHFNLSHTNGMALFALSTTLPTGIDVEAINPAYDWEETARRFFHPNEWNRLENLPNGDRTSAGYGLWTCKEACLKAAGDGIGGGLETFEVPIFTAVGDEARIDLPKGKMNDGLWLRRLDVGPGFAAALATVGRATRSMAWNWHGTAKPFECESWKNHI